MLSVFTTQKNGGRQRTLEVMILFVTWIVMMVALLYTYIPTHQIVHIKSFVCVPIIIYKAEIKILQMRKTQYSIRKISDIMKMY